MLLTTECGKILTISVLTILWNPPPKKTICSLIYLQKRFNIAEHILMACPHYSQSVTDNADVEQQWSFLGNTWKIHSTHAHWHLCICIHPFYKLVMWVFFIPVFYLENCVFAVTSRQILPIQLSNCWNRNKGSWTLIILMFQSFSTLSGLSPLVFSSYNRWETPDVHSLHHLMMKSTNGPLQSRQKAYWRPSDCFSDRHRRRPGSEVLRCTIGAGRTV